MVAIPCRRMCALALLVAALATPLRGEEYDPYRIPRDQFRDQVARLALRPLRLPDGTADAERVRAALEGLLTAELEKRGYAVVPSRVWATTWLPFAQDLGGVFDPVTGRPDDKKYELAWRHTAREVERSQDIDAVVSPEVAFDVMPATIGWTAWKAAGQSLRWRGNDLVSAANQQPQRVEGPYLAVLIHDPAQVTLYDIRIPLAWARFYFGGGYEEVPAAELYADRAHNQETVVKLLEPLVDRKDGGAR